MIKNLNDYGISFNGHHSKEFGLDVLSKKIGFPSKNKALKKYKDYIIEYSGQSNCKVTIQEESFKAVIDGSKNENIFSAEYMRIVIR